MHCPATLGGCAGRGRGQRSGCPFLDGGAAAVKAVCGDGPHDRRQSPVRRIVSGAGAPAPPCTPASRRALRECTPCVWARAFGRACTRGLRAWRARACVREMAVHTRARGDGPHSASAHACVHASTCKRTTVLYPSVYRPCAHGVSVHLRVLTRPPWAPCYWSATTKIVSRRESVALLRTSGSRALQSCSSSSPRSRRA